MNINAIFLILLLCLVGCKKNAPKTHPEIVGTWHLLKWCDTNNYPKKDFNVDFRGKGSYQSINDSYNDEERFVGKVKTKNDKLFIRNHFIFTILSITDTTAILKNPYAPSMCGKDEIQVSGLLEVMNENGDRETYWKH